MPPFKRASTDAWTRKILSVGIRNVSLQAVEAAENILPVAAIEEVETLHKTGKQRTKLYFKAEKDAIFLILTGESLKRTRCEDQSILGNLGNLLSRDGEFNEFGNQRTVTVAGARETVGSPVVQKTGIQCFNCKGFGHYARECRKPKRVKDYAYHKEKMMMCKQAEQGVPLQAEQADWLEDTDEEIDEQELEAHYSYMAKIQEVSPAESSSTDTPLEQVQNHDENDVFANVRRHSEQPESINDTYVLEKDDSNVIPDSSNICTNDNQVDQNASECVDERAALANLIANLTLDTEENKTIIKQLKKANASLTQELKECKTNLDESSRALGEATSSRDSSLIALQTKQTELEKYTALNDRTSDYKILQTKLNETLGLLALKDIDIQEGLKTKTYEISVVNQKHDELVKKSLLTRSQFEGQLKEKSKVISDLKVKEGKDIDTMIEMDKQIKFLNEILYKRNQSIQTIHMLAPKCATYNGRSTFANPKYLKIAQSEKPRLYEIPYDTSDPANRFCPNGEETVTLEKESRSKLDKDKVKPYDYTYQNSLYETFKPPSKTYLDQLERAKEVRKTMWRKTFNRTKPNIAKNELLLGEDATRAIPNMGFNLVNVEGQPLIQKSKSYYKKLYENTNQEWKWWIAKRCPSVYTWTQKPLRTKKIWMPKIRKADESTSISPTIDIVSRITNIVQLILFIVDSGCTKHMTGNLKLLCNFVEKFLGTVRFGNDQFAPILGYGDLIQGNVTIKRVYYVEGLNHNLFSVGQFCDADLEVAFRKSTCFVRDLQGNDLLTGSRGSDLYTISLQETTSSTPICFMAKASPTQAWLWHRRLSHLLNFDYIHITLKERWPCYSRTKGVRKGLCTTLTPCPPRQNVVPSAERKTDSSQTSEIGESSSRNIDNTDVHSFQPQSHDYRWTRDHPLEQVRGNPTMPVQTRRQLATDPEMCMFALTWLWKNKKDEDQNVIRNKATTFLVAKGYVRRWVLILKNHFAPVASLESVRIFVAQASNKSFPNLSDGRVWYNRHFKWSMKEEVYFDQPEGDSGFELKTFSDADHAGCLDTRKSTSGGIQFLGDKLVSWISKKQNCFAMSSAEAEYVALSASCAQVMWMRT
ncbi:retrovirus-related pol polyprotein from transposon TNT 1-94 [Tanacetum coccineum]|uniref:Retrovirus-related pol polyprotein from transposon TNT 1-94 n=1 Tax=Tanacetum coccineum TaxID=301880 RepID=A0ABQ5B540_9ASTR